MMVAAVTRKMEAQGTPIELSGEVYSIDEGSVPDCLRDDISGQTETYSSRTLTFGLNVNFCSIVRP